MRYVRDIIMYRCDMEVCVYYMERSVLISPSYHVSIKLQTQTNIYVDYSHRYTVQRGFTHIKGSKYITI